MTRNADAHFSVGTAANRQLNVPAPSHLMTWSADSLAQNQPSIPSLGNLNLRNPGIWSKREELTPRRQSPVVAARMARIVSSSNISPRYTTFTQRWSPVSPLDLSLTQSSHRAQTAGERGFAFIARYGGIARSPARQAASRSGQSPELETSVASRQTSQHSSLPVKMTPRDRSLKRQIITERKLRIVRQESSTPGASSSNLACLSEANGSRTRLLSQEQLKKQGSSIHHGGETGLTDKSPVAAPLTVEQLLKKPPQKASTSVGRRVQTPEISISLRGSFSAGNDSLSSAHVAELSTTTARELPSGGVPCVVPHRMSDKSMSASISSCVHPVIVQRRRCSDCTTKPAPSATTSPGTMTATTAGATPTTSSNRSQSSVETVTDIPSVGQVAAPYNGQKSSFVSSRLVMQQFVQRWSNHYEENKKAYFEGGYMSVVPGKKLNSRYVIVQKLGWGEFSTVWLAYDTLHTTLGKPHQAFVAVKIAKCDSVVSESTQYEIKLLRYIGSNTPSHAPLTGLLDSFEVAGQYGSHTCMVMPLHGSNLLSIIDQMKAKKGIRSPSEISLIKEIVVSILIGLDELDKLDVIHTDIKPENILCSSSDPKVLDTIENFCLRNKDRSSMVPADRVRKAMWQGDPNHLVCIADFGLSVALKPSKGQAVTGKGQKDVAAKAAIESKKEFPVEKAGTVSNVRGTMIQTREYRAPEILMGMDFNTRTDIWSVGCMVYELITGEFLMDPKRRTRNERMMDVEHLAMMMQILGPVPEKIIKLREGCGNGKPPPRYIHRYFDENNRFIYSDKYRLYPRRHIDRELQAYLPPAEAKSAAAFIVGCLASYEPTSRPSAGEMLNHTWLYDATNN
ncbi:protein kinase [Trypanosoma brucei equiperdum]|uniref:non-specific serine/threonine protein kinase n=1 Tax=Trypanosoma brucei equiperdum TaxID=630700 RepID=A0A3L6L3M9_9TRYP|nr:protein kinase [Trypanosoma brucei equiperdum]